MFDLIEEKKIHGTMRVHWTILYAFVSALVMYIFVIYRVTSSSTAKPSDHDTLRWVLIALSVFAGMAKFAGQRIQAEKKRYEACEDLDRTIKKYNSFFLFSMFMCQVPALCGVIMAFVTMRMGEYWLFMGISAILFATSTPQRSMLENIVTAQRARHPVDDGAFAGEIKPQIDENALRAAGDFEIPSLSRRALAFIIDLTFMILVFFLLLRSLFLEMEGGAQELVSHSGIATLAVFIAYHSFLVGYFGKTVGCIVTNLKIISADSPKLDFRRAFT